MLKLVYSFFLGLLLAVFVGLGVASFYPQPKAPEYPKELEMVEDRYTETQKKIEDKYESDNKAYYQRLENYHRNVSIIVLAAAVVLVVLGLILHSRTGVIADGLLLGGVFTLLYSIGRSFAGGDPKYSFMVTAVGLIITMVVGYIKFIGPKPAAAKSKKK